jgi:hypothetical protein
VQVHAARRHDAVRRPQVLRVREHQRRRQQRVAQQRLRAVHVGQRRIEQARALDHAALDGGPLVDTDDERQQLQRPFAARVALRRMHVVGGAVFVHASLHARRTRRQLARRRTAVDAERIEEGLPHGARRALRRTGCAGGVAQLVEGFLCGDAGPAQAAPGIGGSDWLLGRPVGHLHIMPMSAVRRRP